MQNCTCFIYSKTCVKQPLSQDQKMVFKTKHGLRQVKSIVECSKGSFLQYFRPSLSYQLSFRPLFCLFLSGRCTQVYCTCICTFYAFVHLQKMSFKAIHFNTNYKSTNLKDQFDIWLSGHKVFFMLNSTDYEIYPAYKC